MTFRRRIIVAMLPLFALLVALGGTGTVLIYHLGNRIDKILRENYDSVIYMHDLNEALERIDSSFQFALAGREQESSRAVRGKLETVRCRPIQGATQHHVARGRRTGCQADNTERPVSPSRRRFFQHSRARNGTNSILASRTRQGSTAHSARSRPFRARFCGSTRTTWKRQIGRHAAWPIPL